MSFDDQPDDCSTAKGNRTAAERANAECLCVTLDQQRLATILSAEIDHEEAIQDLLSSRSHLFAQTSVFIDPSTYAAMRNAVLAIEAAIAAPDFEVAALNWAPSIAARDFGPKGVFMGYDFHLTPSGPQLIEINTNAGGAFLNALLADAQVECCRAARPSLLEGSSRQTFRSRIARMFEQEWRAQGRSDRPGCIAIIDEDPEQQPLFPEFLAARSLLKRHGFETVISAPENLTLSAEGLVFEEQKIDFVYNRLVDFSLDRPESRTLREAYLEDLVVLSPNPRVHALFADKRNLALLSDRNWLAGANIETGIAETLLAAIPETVIVDQGNADHLWSERRSWFFKPARGHGSKAAYRGAKLTKRVWSEIVDGVYVAQRFTPPGVRKVRIDSDTFELKMDLRLYTYDGEILLAAARLYQGQATNMRTPGGGFAPILSLGENFD